MKKNLLISICLFVALIGKGQTTTQLWGTAWLGGANGDGTIFKMNPDGTGFTTVYDFSSIGGQQPYGNLIQASNGSLYGVCSQGGTASIGLSGTIFQYNLTTNNCVVVHNFDTPTGRFPESGLVEAPNGLFYGTASYGGINNKGALYSFDPATNTYTDLFDFVNITGATPFYAPIVSNNKLYGIASYAGLYNAGTFYSYDLQTNIYTDLFNFNGTTDGNAPYGGIVLANDGKIYGNTLGGGVNNKGVIFSFDPIINSFNKLYDFNTPTGEQPNASLMQANNNKLYGTGMYGGSFGHGVIFSYDLITNTYSDLYNFDSIDGIYPVANLIQFSNGLLYGTTVFGGIGTSSGAGGDGVVFSFDITTNTYTKLIDFIGSNGSNPVYGLLSVDPNVGISNIISSNENISIYPNPATTQLNITINNTNYKTAQINITNIIGENVLQSTIAVANNNQSTINITALSKGMYFVETTIDGKRSVIKMVKE